jgi:DNA polymerase-1
MSTMTFNRLPGDAATYTLGDGEGAVMLAKTSPYIAVDIETGSATSERRWNVKAVAIGTAGRAFVLDPDRDRQAIRDAMQAAGLLVFHGSSYDVPIMVSNGLMRVSQIHKVFDTVISARMAAPGETVPKKLGIACERYLGGDYSYLKTALETGFANVTKTRSKSAMFDILGLDSPAYVAYAAFDVVMTARLYDALPAAVVERLGDCGPFPSQADRAPHLIRREQVINQMMLARSAKGIAIDYDEVDAIQADLRNEMAVAGKVLSDAGIDPDDSAVKRVVVDHLDALGLLPGNWPTLKSGLRTTDKKWVEKVGHPLGEALLARTQAERFIKDYSTKVLSLARDGRIHPQVNILVATTGRMSYGSPPIQQYPGRVRAMFRAEEPITSFDWSSIEPVYFANLAGDMALLEEFESGGDLYQPVADAAGVSRSVAKTILLAALYGQGIPSLAVRLGVTVDEARSLNERVFARMPDIKAMMDKIRNVGKSAGVVPTMSGRVIPLEKDFRYGGFKGYVGVNAVIQGSAYDLLAEALLSIHEAGLSDAVWFAVHDELVVSTEAADDVQRIMTTPPPDFIEAAGRVPVLRVGRADLGHNWREKN